MVDVHALQNNAEIEQIAQKRELSLVVLFGSRATGKSHEKSDVDVAVQGRSRFSPRELAEIADELGSVLRRGDIEVLDIRFASPLLLRDLALQGVVLFESEPTQYEDFRIYALKRYMEAKPLLMRRLAQLNTFISQPL